MVHFVVGGAIGRKTYEEAIEILELLAKQNKQSSDEPSKGLGIVELEKILTLERKIDAMMLKMKGRDNRHSPIDQMAEIQIVDEGLTQEEPYRVEEVQYVGGSRSYNL